MARCSFALLILLLAGCAGSSRRTDSLCGEMLRFANSVPPSSEHAVELCVSWGSACSENKDVLSSWSCEHAGYEPGSRFCDYLLAETSAEFPNANFSRALACLGKRVYAPKRYVDYNWGDASVRTAAMPGLAAGREIELVSKVAVKRSPAMLQVIVRAD